jgi:hypothetical protein
VGAIRKIKGDRRWKVHLLASFQGLKGRSNCANILVSNYR